MNLDPIVSEEVAQALHDGSPVVALESTVISHGLPFPENLNTAKRMCAAVRSHGAVPAITAMIEGRLRVGLSENEIGSLARPGVRKLSVRDLPLAAALGYDGATTVATTSLVAFAAGIRVFATGGIGGVHRGSGADVSADLPALARTPLTVVCSGAKSVLDLEATREWLETYGIPVLGFKTDELPAFYAANSGLSVDERVNSVEEAARVVRARDEMGLGQAVLLTVPVPQKDGIPGDEFEAWMERALEDASRKGVSGKEVTPFLLSTLSELSGGRTLTANVSLLENNASVAAELSVTLSSSV